MACNNNVPEVLEPKKRLELLVVRAESVSVDTKVQTFRYYRSGTEMIRQARIYEQEKNLEDAYVLYVKFMTLFLVNIPKSPTIGEVPKKMLVDNKRDLKEALPVTERIKDTILKSYMLEYEQYMKSLEIHTKPTTVVNIPKPSRPTLVTLETPSIDLDSIQYPETPEVPPAPIPSKIEVPPPPTIPTPPTPPPPPPPVPSTPTINRSIKPDLDNKKKLIGPNYPLRKDGLRTVIVPATVINYFMQKAKNNTAHNIETCAVLTGKLERNQLIITHLVLPKQKGTGDSCVTMNEEELFDVQDEHNLLTIGWIHTHPTQTAFLSSIDLHTQYSYQVMMPEAIAIVCAPSYSDTGYYVLTPDQGLKTIGNCRKDGFHSHPGEGPLYMTAEHIKIIQTANLDVVDLRTSK